MEPFSHIIRKWYQENKRALPWREVKDPYLIWISEIILQQTRVIQGYDYYLRFIERFPNVESLAKATEDEVLNIWQGLGYYSRARNLHHAANQIVESGNFPSSFSELKTLKGIGDYTAAAIASFAFNLPHAVVDGNVYRVLSRYFAIEIPIDTSAGKYYYAKLANELLDKDFPAEYNQALMDFGAIQCIPSRPDCSKCPLSDSCLAKANNKISFYPIKSHKIKSRERYFHYVYIRYNEYIILHKRTTKDIWQGLYEPFLIEGAINNEETVLSIVQEELLRSTDNQLIRFDHLRNKIKHVLSHQVLWVDFYYLSYQGKKDFFLPKSYIKVREDKRNDFAVPKIVEIIYSTIDKEVRE